MARPQKIAKNGNFKDDPIVKKLLQAFSFGCNISEACAFAGVSRVTYYKYLEAHPELVELIEQAKEMPIAEARRTVFKAIQYGDGQLALKFLALKRPEEFKTATRQDITVTSKYEEMTEAERLAEIERLKKKAVAINSEPEFFEDFEGEN